MVHEGTTSLSNPAVLNDWILRLYEAAHGIEGANSLCSKRNPAWPGWYSLQDFLYRLAQQALDSQCARLDGVQTCKSFCMGAWVTLSGTLAAWGNPLGEMLADMPQKTVVESFSACDPNYFKLGFRLAYAHHRLQLGDRDSSDTQVREAIRHVGMLESCRPWSGYCVGIWHPQLIKPDLYLLLDRNRLRTPDAARMIFDSVIGKVARTMINGNAQLRLLRCPGTDQRSPKAQVFLTGGSRASQRLASRPTVTVPPNAPAATPPVVPPTFPPPPAPPSPPPPSPPRIYNLSGTWQPAQGGPAEAVITGGTTRYTVSGTGANRVRNECTLAGDGTTFEGRAKDVPGYCCGREGYVWLEVIDQNTYRVRSVWWTPGQGSKEKPQLTYGWSRWTRRSR
jgi:hypothetical protein